MTSNPILIEEIINTSIDKIWNAITDKTEMAQWYFNLKEFKPEVGFDITFTECNYVHRWTVKEVIPQHIISYDWNYPDFEGKSTVTFELLYINEHETKLVFTHEGTGTFPQNNKDFTTESFNAGWEEIIRKNLRDYLEEKYN